MDQIWIHRRYGTILIIYGYSYNSIWADFISECTGDRPDAIYRPLLEMEYEYIGDLG